MYSVLFFFTYSTKMIFDNDLIIGRYFRESSGQNVCVHFMLCFQCAHFMVCAMCV